jgi:hypothetical protein
MYRARELSLGEELPALTANAGSGASRVDEGANSTELAGQLANRIGELTNVAVSCTRKRVS